MSGRLDKELAFYKKMDEKIKQYPPIFNEYYAYLRANKKTCTTIRTYLNNLIHFANFITNNNITNNFYKINIVDIEQYFISMETIKKDDEIIKISDSILCQRWSALNNFYSFLLKRNYISENLMNQVERPKNNSDHQPTYLTKKEINKLFKAIDNNPNIPIRERDRTLFSIAFSTGLRISAIVNINIEDIDFHNNFIRVIEKRSKDRDIYFSENLKNILLNWIELRNDYYHDIQSDALFISQKGNRISTDACNDALKKYAEEAKINKKLTMHKCRSTAATNLAAANVDIQTIADILGHKSTSTTLKYVAVLDESKKNAINVLDNLI